MPDKRIAADDLEWEDLPGMRSGIIEGFMVTIGEMRHALSTRRGQWAVVDVMPKPGSASSIANQLGKKRTAGDGRLAGLEFAGRKMLDGGSKLYVRHAP